MLSFVTSCITSLVEFGCLSRHRWLHTVYVHLCVCACVYDVLCGRACVCASASGCVWLSLTASKGAGFILTLIMRERLAMPSSHFSTSSILPVASGCFSFFFVLYFLFLVDNLSFVAFFCPLCFSRFSVPSCHFCFRFLCILTSPWLNQILCREFKCWLTIFHQPVWWLTISEDHCSGSSVSAHSSLTSYINTPMCCVLPGYSNVHLLCSLLPNFPCRFSRECKARVSHSSASINFIPTFHCPVFSTLSISLSLSLSLCFPGYWSGDIPPPPPPSLSFISSPWILVLPTSMDLKDRRHRSLTRGRCPKDPQFNTSSLDADECRVPTQKSYSSSETLKAFDHEQRLHYGGCVTDLVHHEADEYARQGGCAQHHLQY